MSFWLHCFFVCDLLANKLLPRKKTDQRPIEYMQAKPDCIFSTKAEPCPNDVNQKNLRNL